MKAGICCNCQLQSSGWTANTIELHLLQPDRNLPPNCKLRNLLYLTAEGISWWTMASNVKMKTYVTRAGAAVFIY